MLPVVAMCGHLCGLDMTATTAMPEAVLTGFALSLNSIHQFEQLFLKLLGYNLMRFAMWYNCLWLVPSFGVLTADTLTAGAPKV